MSAIYYSNHGFDWTPLTPGNRPGKSHATHLRVLGVGFDYNWNRCGRYYSVAAGANWLLNIAAGRHYDIRDEMRRLTTFAGNAELYRGYWFVEVTLFLFTIARRVEEGKAPLWRFFWRGRRVFHTRKRG